MITDRHAVWLHLPPWRARQRARHPELPSIIVQISAVIEPFTQAISKVIEALQPTIDALNRVGLDIYGATWTRRQRLEYIIGLHAAERELLFEEGQARLTGFIDLLFTDAALKTLIRISAICYHQEDDLAEYFPSGKQLF